jgi:hypothetical protein
MAVTRYFPVVDGPLRVQPSLVRLGKSFGNGPVDGQAFQRDDSTPEALRQKTIVLGRASKRVCVDSRASIAPALRRVLAWMRDRLAAEHRIEVQLTDDPRADSDALSCSIAEDFVVLTREKGGGREQCSLVHVCFPSNWRPEAVFKKDFRSLHDPVPGFGDLGPAVPRLVQAIFERGPYVRFIWTVCPDDQLDHHPETVRSRLWGDDVGGYLRVERQSLFPFREVDASLFLIRTYLYPFEDLTHEQQRTLASALRQMPPEMLRYKGLESARPRIVGALEALSGEQ